MDVRRDSLKALTEREGGTSGLAKRMGWKGPSYVSQLINGHRPISEKTARGIEKKFRLQEGWMDLPHEPSADDSIPAKLMLELADALQQAGVDVGPGRLARAVIMLMPEASRTGRVDPAKIKEMVELLKNT